MIYETGPEVCETMFFEAPFATPVSTLCCSIANCNYTHEASDDDL